MDLSQTTEEPNRIESGSLCPDAWAWTAVLCLWIQVLKITAFILEKTTDTCMPSAQWFQLLKCPSSCNHETKFWEPILIHLSVNNLPFKSLENTNGKMVFVICPVHLFADLLPGKQLQLSELRVVSSRRYIISSLLNSLPYASWVWVTGVSFSLYK